MQTLFRKTPLRALIFFLVFFVSTFARAGLFKISNRTYGNVPAQYQADMDLVFNTLEDLANSFLPATDNATFMHSMGNAASLSGAGNLANYGSPIRDYELGANAGVAISASSPASGSSFTINNIAGVGAQAVVRGGFNTKIFGDQWWIFDLKKAYGYIGFFNYVFTQDKTRFEFDAISLYGQYRVVEPSSVWWDTVKWNGLNLGLGFRYVNLKVAMDQTITTATSAIPVNSLAPGATASASYTGFTSVGADIKTYTIPIEVSTSARLLYVFTPFVGFGVDLGFGKAKSVARISGPINVTTNPSTFGTFSGTGTLDLGDEAGPRTLTLRSFTGIQLEAGVAALTIVNTRVLNSKQETAINGGFKLYW